MVVYLPLNIRFLSFDAGNALPSAVNRAMMQTFGALDAYGEMS
jgi:hypothetical protein